MTRTKLPNDTLRSRLRVSRAAISTSSSAHDAPTASFAMSQIDRGARVSTH